MMTRETALKPISVSNRSAPPSGTSATLGPCLAANLIFFFFYGVSEHDEGRGILRLLSAGHVHGNRKHVAICDIAPMAAATLTAT